MAAGWNENVTNALISIWGQESVQSQFDSIVRKVAKKAGGGRL